MATVQAPIMREFRAMLVTVDRMLRQDELERMKFMSKDYGLGSKLRERIKNGYELFEALEERKLLAPNDLNTLNELLQNSCGGRKDVLEVVDKFRKSFDLQIQEQNGVQNANADVSQACMFLESNLGREYLMVLRRCGIADALLDQLQDQYPRNVPEVIHQALGAWKKSLDASSAKTKLIQALRAEKRNDLANKLERSEYS